MKGITWNVESLELKHEGLLYRSRSIVTAEIEGVIDDIEAVARVWPTKQSCQYGLSNILNGYQNQPKIQKVIFNNPATIILWTDGTKTVVKCQPGDVYDKEKGFAMAYLKKLLGNDNTFNKEINKWVDETPWEIVCKTYAELGIQAARACYETLMSPVKSATDEEKGCDICRQKSLILSKKYATRTITGERIYYSYCPFCGAKLKEESK